MSRKHMPLLVGGLVVLLLSAALLYLLFSMQGSYGDSFDALTMAQSKLHRLTSRPVFPSADNVQAMGHQLKIYEEYLDGLSKDMRKGQGPELTIDRDGFRRMLEEGLRQLVNDARAKSVTIAPNLAFGVQRYIEGNPPSAEEIPRLVDQFRSIAALCNILYDAGIGELTSVERTVFEKDAQIAVPEEDVGRRGRGRAEPVAAAPSAELFRDPDGLFTKEHYVLSYRANDVAHRKVMDRLASGAPFTVVTQMEITNPARPAVVPPKSATDSPESAPPQPVAAGVWQAAGTRGGAPAAAPEILPRELRVVAGRELSDVRLEVDLYRFADTASGDVKGEENP